MSKIKADGKVETEDFTYFQKLWARVEVLQEQIILIGRILKQHDMTSVTDSYDMTPDFDDETYRKLEE